jgi:hypothetical protein
VGDTGYELTDASQFLRLDQLSLSILERVHGELELFPGALEVFGHAVEYKRKFSAFVLRTGLNAAGKITATDRFGAVTQFAQRFRNFAHEKPDDRGPQQNGCNAGAEEQLARGFE